MKKIVIGIHGLGNKVAPPVLSDWWMKSIKEGLGKIGLHKKEIPFELVYWADVNHPIPLNHESIDPDDPLYVEDPYIKGSPVDEKKSSYLKRKLFGYIDGFLDKIFLGEDMRIRLKGITDKIIRRYFSDLEAYFRNSCVNKDDLACSANRNIKNKLYQVLEKYKNYDILLIAHSMGSIIAFDVLTEYSRQLHINTLVTIGSPLGLPVIIAKKYEEQKKINPKIRKPKIPDCIWPHWYNLSDPEDKVAMDHAINNDFAKNGHGLKIRDITVYNNYQIKEKRNPHKAYGYLRTPEMANIIDLFMIGRDHNSFTRAARKLSRTVKTKIQNIGKII